MDSAEVASILGTTQSNVRQLVATGKLTKRGIANRRSLFAWDDVQRLRDEREAHIKPATPSPHE